MKRKLIRTATALVAFAALSLSGMAVAQADASTTVTIKTQNGDFWGTVSSSNNAKCSKDRMIKVYKVKSGKDEYLYQDTASKEGGKFKWATGNTHVNGGHYYAKAPKINGCDSDKSPTVKA